MLANKSQAYHIMQRIQDESFTNTISSSRGLQAYLSRGKSLNHRKLATGMVSMTRYTCYVVIQQADCIEEETKFENVNTYN